MENIYKWAARECVKFQSPKGILGVEDLFRVDLDILDQVYRSLKMQLKDADVSDSLLDDNSGSEEAQDLRLAIELVTDVFKTRKEEAELAEKKLKKAKERQKIAEIIAEKEESGLRDMSIEELKAMLEGD